MHVPRSLGLRVHEGLPRTCGDGNVGPTGQVQHAQRVLGRLRQFDVAVHGGDEPEVDLRAGQGQQEGQRVVDAGVGVDHQGDAEGHRGILPAAPDTPRSPGADDVTGPSISDFHAQRPPLVDM